MLNLADIDINMKSEHTLAPEISEKFEFYDCENEPFSIHGVFREDDSFVRLPKCIAKSVSQGVASLYSFTTGGRIRFVTDSNQIAISVSLPNKLPDSRSSLTAITGFDMYADDSGGQRYFGSINPPCGYNGGFEGVFLPFPNSDKRTITINMPRSNTVYKLYIGIKKGSVIEKATEFAEPPVVYYGSSITQGGCASRPGTAYYSIVHRHIDYDYINLGFSGNARGEDEIIDYINGLDMSMFVYDYDHNAPTVEHLKNTHYKGYKKIREKHQSIPILMLSRPKFYLNGDDLARLEVIEESYQKGIAEGDKNLYFIKGSDMITKDICEEALIDHCHPTDIGFWGMAQSIIPIMKKALNII